MGVEIIKNELYIKFRRLRNQNDFSLHILRYFASMVFLLRFVLPVCFFLSWHWFCSFL